MKNRKRIILPNKPVFKRSESNIDKNHLEKAPKQRNFASISLQQNLEYFNQGKYTPKPSYNAGDADAYFKQSLRNYEYFDITVFRTPSNHHFVKTAKSLENFKKKKSNKSLPSSLKLQKKKKQTSSKKSASAQLVKLQKPSQEELDVDIFYSPSSNTLKSSTHTLRNRSSESLIKEETLEDTSKQEETRINMAEDEDEFIDEFKTEEELRRSLELAQQLSESEVEEDTEDEGDELEDTMKQGELTEDQEEEEEGEGEDATKRIEPVGGGDGSAPKKLSTFQFDPTIDAAVLKELEEAEKQAKATSQIIAELKTRVTVLLKKEKHTEEEAKELEAKNKELKAQMILFEEKTKRIEFLIAQSNLFDKMISPQTPLQVKHTEDALPKVIVCGMTEHNIPKLILCDDKKRKTGSSSNKQDINFPLPMSVVPQFAKRLNDSYTMQERLAAENADLESMRYNLQSELLQKDKAIEQLQRKLCGVECELRMIFKENSALNERVVQMDSSRQELIKPKKAPCGKGKGPCPADIENRLYEYSETTRLLERQLVDMENDVKSMQNELTAVQAEREHLEQHKKVIIVPPVCGPHPPCVMPPFTPPCAPCIISNADQHLRELKEQYLRLQDDFKGKVTEVAGLRADNDKLKTIAKDAEESKKTLEIKMKDLERSARSAKLDNNKFAGSKEQIIEQEQQLTVAKQRFREAQDELEELRAFLQDQQKQMDDYRNKYLEAQQEVEEQKRHIDMLEMDANRINEQVNLEIQRVKAQFQEKLQELLPLPDLLKTTQLKLQETQQMHLLAERNNEALNRDLQIYKDKIADITGEMAKARSDQELDGAQKNTLTAEIEKLKQQLEEMQLENDELKNNLEKREEEMKGIERELQAKMHEVAQLSAQLETVREESARQVARNKERCETVRKSMQNQISDLERQLAQSRAQAKSAQKDRDEIRQKMQAQINNLHENFEDAQMRIRNLQGHVNFLKDSYNTTTVTRAGDTESIASEQDACNCNM